MAVNKFTDPIGISIFGDSWAANAYAAYANHVATPLSAMAQGFGYKESTPDYMFIDFSWGGTSAADAYYGTGSFANPDELNILAPFSMAVNHDFATYQVFRYGYNDVNAALPFSASRLMNLHGVDRHSKIPAVVIDSIAAELKQKMVMYTTSFVDASRGSGRKPVLSKLCRLTPGGDPYGWTWQSQHSLLLDKVNEAIGEVANLKAVPVVDQSNHFLSQEQMADYVHPNTKYNHRLNMEFGLKLRQVIDAGY